MLSYMLYGLIGCAALLQVENKPTDDSSSVEVSVPTQFGIIDTDSCDQTGIGSTVCNMVFYDHNKDVWQLYDHEGKVIVLDFSTVWCGPCQAAGHHAQPIQDSYAGNVEFVTILVEGATGDPPTEAEIQEWVTVHSITTSPVLFGDRTVMDQTGENGYLVGGFPTYVFIDRQLKIHSGIVGFNDEYIRTVIERLL